MAKNIEEFLRMAAARRQQQGAAAPQQPGRQQQQNQQPATPRISTPTNRQQPRTDVVEIVDDIEVVDPLRDQSVGSHVRAHINTSDIAEHTRQLGGQVSQASEEVEKRIHQKFDHEVGHLGADHIADANEYSAEFVHAEHDDVAPRAKELAEMLKSPKTFRQAIIMSEILNRPNFE